MRIKIHLHRRPRGNRGRQSSRARLVPRIAGHGALAASLGCGGLALWTGLMLPAAGLVCLLLAVMWWAVGAACLDTIRS